jgi:hypothetical protein
MPIDETVRKMKIAPLGNFHDNTESLPVFYQNYTSLSQAEFEQLIGSAVDNKIQDGGNKLIKAQNGDIYLYFNSTSNIVMKRNGGRYNFHAVYRNIHSVEAEYGTLGEDPYTQYGDLTNDAKREKIKGVFSTMITSCGLQTAFIGGTKDEPEYIVISHLQGKSRLGSIADKLKISQENIHAVLSIAFPWVGSCSDAATGIDNYETKSVTLIRDANLWPDLAISSGFGMKLCGYIFDNASLRLVMIPTYGKLFASASAIDITRFPVFNSTPEGIQVLFQKLINPKEKIKAQEIIQNYYFDIFKDGDFGDKFFIKQMDKSTADIQHDIKKDFLDNYKNSTSKDLEKTFIEKVIQKESFFPQLKYITWQSAFTPKQIIDGIIEFKDPDINTTFKDMAIAPKNQTAQEVGKIVKEENQ